VNEFYYRYGKVETNKQWLIPPPKDNFNNWLNDFKQLDLEDYNVYLGGKYVIDPNNTDDIDICLTGPIYNYNNLYNILKTGLDLALNKWNIYVDIKHYDNIDFFKYPRREDFVRLHAVTEMSGEQIKIINRIIKHQSTKSRTIPHPSIPENIVTNMQEIPYPKQIADGRIYDPIKLI
jgi:hypothetical protein|tara:strand:+ start:353 stop:883 length:531 start_codon:yes stop_codon:yes gene_type:complete